MMVTHVRLSDWKTGELYALLMNDGQMAKNVGRSGDAESCSESDVDESGISYRHRTPLTEVPVSTFRAEDIVRKKKVMKLSDHSVYSVSCFVNLGCGEITDTGDIRHVAYCGGSLARIAMRNEKDQSYSVAVVCKGDADNVIFQSNEGKAQENYKTPSTPRSVGMVSNSSTTSIEPIVNGDQGSAVAESRLGSGGLGSGGDQT